MICKFYKYKFLNNSVLNVDLHNIQISYSVLILLKLQENLYVIYDQINQITTFGYK